MSINVSLGHPPNYFDFLVVFDDHIRTTNLGYITYAADLFKISETAGLSEPGEQLVAHWAGQCVENEYIAHSPPGMHERPFPPPTLWNQQDMSRIREFRITRHGREEADRVRRQRREDATDGLLASALPSLNELALSEDQRRAIEVPLANLRSALDNERYEAAIGASKELAEAACKLAAAVAGRQPEPNSSLPTLLKLALADEAEVAPGAELARRLSGVLDGLGNLRNDVGTGHGRAEQSDVDSRTAALAASTACTLARFVLVKAGSRAG